MQDRIILHNMQFSCMLGCYPEEKSAPQPITVAVELFTDTLQAATTDSLQDTIDTHAVFSLVQRIVADNTAELMECLCERISAELLHCFPAKKVVVCVEKQQPVFGKETGVKAKVCITRDADAQTIVS